MNLGPEMEENFEISHCRRAEKRERGFEISFLACDIPG